MDGLATALVVISILFPILSALVLMLRLLARRVKVLRIQLEDYMIIVAWILSTAMAVADIIAVYVGQFGEPYAYESYADLTVFTKVIFALQLFHLFSVGLTKASILVFYKKVFQTPTFTIWANVLLVAVVAWVTAFFFTTLFQAWPISQNWTGVGHHLLNESAMYLALGVTDMITDLAILIMPIPCVCRLHADRTKKLMVGGIFGVGFFCVAASIVRVYYLNVVNSNSVEDIDTYTWYFVDFVMWTQIETCWSIICASLPLLVPMFHNKNGLSTMLQTLRSILSLGSSSSLVPSVPARKPSDESLNPDAGSAYSSPIGSPTNPVGRPTRRDAYEMPSLAKDIETSLSKDIEAHMSRDVDASFLTDIEASVSRDTEASIAKGIEV